MSREARDTTDWDLFELDPGRLDSEWLQQPRLYHENALKLADAKAEFERTKARRDVVDAELDRDIRLDPNSFGVVKITETVVQQTILLHKDHQRANDAVIQSKHKVDILTALVDALAHRKCALENLVQLEARDYFSTPRVPVGAGGKMVKERQADQAFGARKNRKAGNDD